MSEERILDETITLVQNDKLFSKTFTVVDKKGEPLDLTGQSSIKFKMFLDDAVSSKIDAAMSVVGAEINGQVQYTFQAGDLDTVGIYNAEIETTYSSGKILTAKGLKVNVVVEAP